VLFILYNAEICPMWKIFSVGPMRFRLIQVSLYITSIKLCLRCSRTPYTFCAPYVSFDPCIIILHFRNVTFSAKCRYQVSNCEFNKSLTNANNSELYIFPRDSMTTFCCIDGDTRWRIWPELLCYNRNVAG
jgi:hypothetical protein